MTTKLIGTLDDAPDLEGVTETNAQTTLELLSWADLPNWLTPKMVKENKRLPDLLASSPTDLLYKTNLDPANPASPSEEQTAVAIAVAIFKQRTPETRWGVSAFLEAVNEYLPNVTGGYQTRAGLWDLDALARAYRDIPRDPGAKFVHLNTTQDAPPARAINTYFREVCKTLGVRVGTVENLVKATIALDKATGHPLWSVESPPLYQAQTLHVIKELVETFVSPFNFVDTASHTWIKEGEIVGMIQNGLLEPDSITATVAKYLLAEHRGAFSLDSAVHHALSGWTVEKIAMWDSWV